MKPTFLAKALNNPFEDPCLYVRLLREKRAILFDMGKLEPVATSEANKVTEAFVTHTHIDHFIGFDHLLRNILGRREPLRIYGPEEIIGCIQGKLSGYVWNLIGQYPLKIEAYGISQAGVRHVSFHARRKFEPSEAETVPLNEGMLFSDGHITVKAAVLEHDIACIGYSMEEDFHINIDKPALEKLGLQVGPWLGEFKKAIRAGAPEDTVFEGMRLGELKEKISMITRGQKIAYIMDSSPSAENIQKITELAKGADSMYCEAYFLDREAGRAAERSHLTARIIGTIARDAGVGEMVIMHCSPRYQENAREIYEEAARYFGGRVSPAKGGQI